MAALTPAPKWYETDDNGDPLVGGKIYTYATGTSTPLATYTDAGGGTPNANPVILDAAGRANIWLSGDALYRFEVYDADDVLQYGPVDNVGFTADGMSFIASGDGAVRRTVQNRMRDTVHLNDYDSLSSAIAAITPGAAPGYGGGTIIVPVGEYDISASDSSPTVITKHQLSFQGEGRLSSILLGAIDIQNASRGHFSDCWLDGEGTQPFVLGVCANGGAGAGGWEFERVAISGGLDYGVFVGNGSNNPDVAANTFRQCNLQCGAFTDAAAPLQAQLAIAGSNTTPLIWIGGVIGGGAVSHNIRLIGGSLELIAVQQINSTLYNILMQGGSLIDTGSHIEVYPNNGGGYLKWESTDTQPLESAASVLNGLKCAATGENTAGVLVLNESGRRLMMNGCFFNGDVTMNNAVGVIEAYGTNFGQLDTTLASTITGASWSGGVITFTTAAPHGTTTGKQVLIAGMTPSGYNGTYTTLAGTSGSSILVAKASDPGAATVMGTARRQGMFVRAAGKIIGSRKGGVIGYGDGLYLETSSIVTYGDTRKALSRWEGTLSSSADVNGPFGTSIEFRVREEDTGNEARVNYHAGATPVVTNIFGAVFVLGSPGAGEIEVKNNATNDGVAFLADTAFNGTAVQATVVGL